VFEVDDVMTSGVPWTSDFNGFWNSFMTNDIIHRAKGKSYEQICEEYIQIFQGDDNATRGDVKDINWTERFLDYGFSAKPIVCENGWDVEFCSTRLSTSTQGPVFVPKAGKMISKLSVVRQFNGKHPSLILRSAAMSLWKSSLPDPILRIVLAHILRLTTDFVGKEIQYKTDWTFEDGVECEPDMEAIAQCSTHYGMDLAKLQELDVFMNQQPTLRQCFDHPYIHMIIDADTPLAQTLSDATIPDEVAILSDPRLPHYIQPISFVQPGTTLLDFVCTHQHLRKLEPSYYEDLRQRPDADYSGFYDLWRTLSNALMHSLNGNSTSGRLEIGNKIYYIEDDFVVLTLDVPYATYTNKSLRARYQAISERFLSLLRNTNFDAHKAEVDARAEGQNAKQHTTNGNISAWWLAPIPAAIISFMCYRQCQIFHSVAHALMTIGEKNEDPVLVEAMMKEFMCFVWAFPPWTLPYYSNHAFVEALALAHNAAVHAVNGNPPKSARGRGRSRGRGGATSSKKGVHVTIQMPRASSAPAPKSRPRKTRSRTGNVSGRGAYTFSEGAANLGGAVGAGVDMLWNKFVKGKGDYQVQKNSLSRGEMPALTFASSSRGVPFCHAERFDQVFSQTSFSLSYYPMNSTNANLLPWLSQLMTLFEEVEWLGFLVEFRTTSGNVTTSQALGAVYLAALYDPHDAGFGTSNQMMSTLGAVETVPCRSAILPIECAPRSNVMTRYYSPLNGNSYNGDTAVVGPGVFNAPDALADRFTTHANIFVGVEGCPTTNQKIGDLFAVAHVAVSKPRILNSNTLSGQASFLGTVQFGVYSVSNVTTGTLFDFSGVSNILAGTNLPISWNVAGNTFNFPAGFPGIYRVTINFNWGSAVTVPTLSFSSFRLSSFNGLPGAANPPILTNVYQIPVAGTSSTTATMNGIFYPNILGGTFTVTTSSLTSTAVVYSMVISQIGLLN